MGLMDHIRKTMNPNSVVEEAEKKITVAAPMTLDERLKASIAEAVDPKTKKKQTPVAPDLKPPVQKPDPNAGKPPPAETVADPDMCKQEKYAAKGADQDEVKLGGKTPVDLNPTTDPPSPKDIEDPAALKKGKKKVEKVDETFKDAMKLAGGGAARIAGRGVAHGLGLPPKKTVAGVEKFVSAWRRPGTARAAPAATSATVGSTRSQGSTRRTASSQRQRSSGASANAARYRAGRTSGTATVGTVSPGGPRPRPRPGSGGAAVATAATAPAKRRTSLSTTTAAAPATQHNAPASGKYATQMKGVIADIKAKRDSSKPRASSVLGKSSKPTASKAPAAKDMSIKKTSTALSGGGTKRARTSLSGDTTAAKPAATQHSSNEPTRMDRKDFAKQMKASGNNLKKIRTSLSDEFIVEWKGNRYNQPAPLSSHTADEHFEKMIDHHDAGLDAKERGDKSAARVHFNTRDHHFSHFVHKATEHELHKRKLNMHKVRAMLDIKEEANPLNKVMSIYRKLRAV